MQTGDPTTEGPEEGASKTRRHPCDGVPQRKRGELSFCTYMYVHLHVCIYNTVDRGKREVRLLHVHMYTCSTVDPVLLHQLRRGLAMFYM